MFSMRALFIKRAYPPPVKIPDMTGFNVVLLTHAHYDHMDIPTLRALDNSVLVISAWNTSDIVRKAGKKDIIEMRPWQQVHIPGATITATPAKHWGARNVYDFWRGYVGYIVTTEEATVYVAGDTGYGRHFNAISRHSRIDVACLPIGCYRPFWFRINHLSPSDSIMAFKDLRAEIMVPVHWGAFRLSLEALEDPVKDLKEIMGELPIKILNPGEGFTYSRSV